MTIENAKMAMRNQMKQQRAKLSVEQILQWSNQISVQLHQIPVCQQAKTLLAYRATQGEAQVDPFCQEFMSREEARLAYPRVNLSQKMMEAVPIHAWTDLAPGFQGIEEPGERRIAIHPSLVEVTLVPGLAFDRKGGRLGYGGGYYDRFLPQLRKEAIVIGICYSFQLVDQILLEDHDHLMDAIVTEQRVYVRQGLPSSKRDLLGL